MSDKTYLDWPFFDDAHRQLAQELEAWIPPNIGGDHPADVDAACRNLVKRLGRDGWLRYAVGGTANGGSDRSEAMFTAMATRHLQHAIDLDSLSAI